MPQVIHEKSNTWQRKVLAIFLSPIPIVFIFLCFGTLLIIFNNIYKFEFFTQIVLVWAASFCAYCLFYIVFDCAVYKRAKAGYILLRIIDDKVVGAYHKMIGKKNIMEVLDYIWLYRLNATLFSQFRIFTVTKNEESVDYKLTCMIKMDPKVSWQALYDEVLKKDNTTSVNSIIEKWLRHCLESSADNFINLIQFQNRQISTSEFIHRLKEQARVMLNSKPLSFIDEVHFRCERLTSEIIDNQDEKITVVFEC